MTLAYDATFKLMVTLNQVTKVSRNLNIKATTFVYPRSLQFWENSVILSFIN